MENDSNVGVYSVYSRDIDDVIPYHQKRVFDKFKIGIQHVVFDKCNLNDRFHANALMEVINQSTEEYLIFFDVDCIPLSPVFYEVILNDIKDHTTLSGIVQCANHVSNTTPYVGTGFFGFSRRLYLDCGSPDLNHIFGVTDVNQSFSIRCKELEKRIRFWMITDPGDSKWYISQLNLKFGHGTVYEDSIYHQFEIRTPDQYIPFIEKCKSII